jgi:hypothetical protein
MMNVEQIFSLAKQAIADGKAECKRHDQKFAKLLMVSIVARLNGNL